MKFNVGDMVKISSKMSHRCGISGKIIKITEHPLYKYDVNFEDGETIMYAEYQLELVGPTLLALPKDTTNPSVFPSIPQELIRFQEYQDSLELKIMDLKELIRFKEYQDSLELKIMDLKELISEKQHELEVLEEELVVVNKLEDIMKGEK